ncbi:hypothetical protein HPP92_013613 [Vanilla planifolia]|uniref:At2g35280-like TPR domain-containing protein n=1 Tax=Vanilla planifolia TaxID=51239 RepID=A0A835QZQ9_VANPL|nr:hypothetical protein HPP92_013613 [Vanilla planifolia]
MVPKNSSPRCSGNNKGIPSLLLKVPAGVGYCHKRLRISQSSLPSGDRSATDLLDQLPEDLLIYILSKLSSSARSPSDLFNALISSKRLYSLRLNDSVLSKASMECLSIRPGKWSVSAHKFLRRCALAGNLEACFILGMIRFYCLGNRTSGMSLLARAALGSHASAMYSIAVIQFNGSGGTKSDKDLRAGVALCARAAALGHLDAIRELGHCLQDGYGSVGTLTPEDAASSTQTTTSSSVSAGVRRICTRPPIHSRVVRRPSEGAKFEL